MKKILKKIKTNKLLFILTLIIVLSIISGIIIYALTSSENKDLITSYLNEFFIQIKSDNINYLSITFSSVKENILINTFIWIIGISIIGIPIIILILIFKGIIIGFSLISIISSYGLIGVIIALIYIIPFILNILVTIYISYYSIRISILIIKYIFKKKETLNKGLFKHNLKVFVYSSIILIITSLIEGILIPLILRLI